MSNKSKSPQTGDMYRCAKCKLEIHVTAGCDCKECTTELSCCGQPLENVTAASV